MGSSKRRFWCHAARRKTGPHTRLEGHLMPSAALDGQEMAQGVSSAPGALAVLPASQATSGSSTMSPAGWFGHSRCTPGLPALGPSSSDRANSDGNSKQDKTPQGLNSVYSKANRFAGLRFELQLTPVQNPNFFIPFQARSSRSGLVQLRKPQCSLEGEQFCCKRGETQVSSLVEAIQVWINNPAVSY